MDTHVFVTVWKGSHDVVTSPFGSAIYWNTLAAVGDIQSWEDLNPNLRHCFEICSATLGQDATLKFSDVMDVRKLVCLGVPSPLGAAEPHHSLVARCAPSVVEGLTLFRLDSSSGRAQLL